MAWTIEAASLVGEAHLDSRPTPSERGLGKSYKFSSKETLDESSMIMGETEYKAFVYDI